MLEMIIHTHTENVVGEMAGFGERPAAKYRRKCGRPVDVFGAQIQVFDLRAPVIQEHVLPAAADRPTAPAIRRLERGASGTPRDGGRIAAVQPSPATGEVDQAAFPGREADATADCCEGIKARLVRECASDAADGRARKRIGPVLTRALDVSFYAEHEAVELPIVSNLAAADHAAG